MTDWRQLGELFVTMARHGGLTFGGGGPTIAGVEYQTIDRRGWLTRDRFRLAFALSRLTPGTNLLAFCAAVGWQIQGVPGCVAALVASSLPCSALTVLLTILLEWWQGNRWAAIAIEGAAASAIGIIAASCWQLMEPHMGKRSRLRTLCLVSGAVILQVGFDISPLRILLVAGIAGAVWRDTP
jgi:chromate transporter